MRSLFNQFDKNGNGKLDLGEFEAALGSCGLFPSVTDLKKLHQYYDVDCDGCISYNEFLNALLPAKLSQR
jgi:Ca2+-binding EF-hand superfamily protein